MDILAAMFAYLVCIAGLVTGLVMSFVVFFSAPGEFSAPPANAIAMAATPNLSPNYGSPASAPSLKTIAKISRSDGQSVAAVPAADSAGSH